MLKKTNDTLNENGIRFCILDEEDKLIRLLVDYNEREKCLTLLKKLGMKTVKDSSKDIYLYGMNRFDYLQEKDKSVTVCYQVACRSTLNGEWVPIDRIVNLTALNDVRTESEGMKYLGYIDEVCYLLAKCVYTQKAFAKEDVDRITYSYGKADKVLLLQKLELVFFGFASNMMKMIEEQNFDDIIVKFMSYSDY